MKKKKKMLSSEEFAKLKAASDRCLKSYNEFRWTLFFTGPFWILFGLFLYGHGLTQLTPYNFNFMYPTSSIDNLVLGTPIEALVLGSYCLFKGIFSLRYPVKYYVKYRGGYSGIGHTYFKLGWAILAIWAASFYFFYPISLFSHTFAFATFVRMMLFYDKFWASEPFLWDFFVHCKEQNRKIRRRKRFVVYHYW